MLNDEISAAGKVYSFTKRCFYLLGNSIAVKNGRAIVMKRKYISFFRGNSLNIGFGIVDKYFYRSQRSY